MKLVRNIITLQSMHSTTIMWCTMVCCWALPEILTACNQLHAVRAFRLGPDKTLGKTHAQRAPAYYSLIDMPAKVRSKRHPVVTHKHFHVNTGIKPLTSHLKVIMDANVPFSYKIDTLSNAINSYYIIIVNWKLGWLNADQTCKFLIIPHSLATRCRRLKHELNAQAQNKAHVK